MKTNIVSIETAREALGLPASGGTKRPVTSSAFIREMRAELEGGAKIPNKFGATRTKTQHGDFDSKHEAKRAGELVLLEQQGYISGLKLKKNELLYALDVNGFRICQYEADGKFTVERDFTLPTLDGQKELKAGESCVIDAKSEPTRKKSAYVIKRNLMLALFQIEILEI